ncbi:hypothetical protein ABZX93_11455 [Streptomyces sp. NPDC006632]|uniref:hypothetical protein n=1 Tax=Streptomyces sp. NPDC006632 TaxID=3157182 RepID=UPI0033A107C0
MSNSQLPPYQPPTAGSAPAPTGRPKWARKRIAIPASFVILFVGVVIGAAGGTDQKKTGAEAKPQPTVTVTVTAAAKAEKAAPQPTVTVTGPPKTKTVETPAEQATPSGTVVFKVWGSAPSGVEVTYGSDSDNRQGSGLPMTKTLKLDSAALYYDVTAQLSGGGDINCSVTVNGRTKTGHASGGYNICTAQLNGGFGGGWS